jgi:hypothetical protein
MTARTVALLSRGFVITMSATRGAGNRFTGAGQPRQANSGSPAVHPGGEYTAGLPLLFSVTSVLGTPLDVNLAELAIESFLPADTATADTPRAIRSPH